MLHRNRDIVDLHPVHIGHLIVTECNIDVLSGITVEIDGLLRPIHSGNVVLLQEREVRRIHTSSGNIHAIVLGKIVLVHSSDKEGERKAIALRQIYLRRDKPVIGFEHSGAVDIRSRADTSRAGVGLFGRREDQRVPRVAVAIGIKYRPAGNGVGALKTHSVGESSDLGAVEDIEMHRVARAAVGVRGSGNNIIRARSVPSGGSRIACSRRRSASVELPSHVGARACDCSKG